MQKLLPQYAKSWVERMSGRPPSWLDFYAGQDPDLPWMSYAERQELSKAFEMFMPRLQNGKGQVMVYGTSGEMETSEMASFYNAPIIEERNTSPYKYFQSTKGLEFIKPETYLKANFDFEDNLKESFDNRRLFSKLEKELLNYNLPGLLKKKRKYKKTKPERMVQRLRMKSKAGRVIMMNMDAVPKIDIVEAFGMAIQYGIMPLSVEKKERLHKLIKRRKWLLEVTTPQQSKSYGQKRNTRSYRERILKLRYYWGKISKR